MFTRGALIQCYNMKSKKSLIVGECEICPHDCIEGMSRGKSVRKNTVEQSVISLSCRFRELLLYDSPERVFSYEVDFPFEYAFDGMADG